MGREEKSLTPDVLLDGTDGCADPGLKMGRTGAQGSQVDSRGKIESEYPMSKATINIGGVTEQERQYNKALLEDGIKAVRGAMQEGIVPGGGTAYVRCIAALDKLKLEGDEQLGVEIVKKALLAPITQILENAHGYEKH